MFTIIGGTILLAFVHSLIPNHWLPLVAVSKGEKWSNKEINTITFLAALGHVLGTVALGIVLGLIGKKLQQQFGEIINYIAPVLLIIFGLIYYTVNLPHHHHSGQRDLNSAKRSKLKWILIFIIMMFLSPCLEVESLFLSGGAYGMKLVVVQSVIYAIVSITGILLLVNLGSRGINLLKAEFIEHNEKRISGIVLIVVGIVTFFIH
jgi:nickel/cobalt exporter